MSRKSAAKPMSSEERRDKGLWIDVKTVYAVTTGEGDKETFVAAGELRTGGSSTDLGDVEKNSAASSGDAQKKAIVSVLCAKDWDTAKVGAAADGDGIVVKRGAARVYFAIATDSGCPVCGATDKKAHKWCPSCQGVNRPTGTAKMSGLLG